MAQPAKTDVTRDGFLIVLASVPAALVGVFVLGDRILAHAAAAPGGSAQVAPALPAAAGSEPSMSASMLAGALYWLPLLAVSLSVAFGLAYLFARRRSQAIDPAWLPAAWLFSLMLPVSTPWGFAALALGFGLVFGCHAFGGSGRYIVSPALLGVVFLALAYPALVDESALLPGSNAPSLWASVAANAGAQDAAGTSLLGAFVGAGIGATGTTSALACLLGAAWLIGMRVLPLTVFAGGLISLVGLGALAGHLPWAWQLAAGNFAFGLAFVAADPTTRPRTAFGSFGFGLLFGALTILLRTANPTHPEGSWAALLLATLAIPLLDHLALARVTRRERPGAPNV